MSRQAVATVEQAADLEPKRRISRRLSQAIGLLTSGECATIKAASQRSGMEYTYLCEALKKPHVQVFIQRATRSAIQAGQMRASARLVGLLDASSEHVSLDASKYVLALGGIKPAEQAVSVSVELKAGFVIDISDKQATVIEAQAIPAADTSAT